MGQSDSLAEIAEISQRRVHGQVRREITGGYPRVQLLERPGVGRARGFEGELLFELFGDVFVL